MASESFSNCEIAGILNANYIAIKVDREERPDVDRVYLMFLEASMGSGGWPMNVWLTPDLKPFFGATYFPPFDRNGKPGLKTVLLRIASEWKSNPVKTAATAEKMMATLKSEACSVPRPTDLALARSERALLAGAVLAFDSEYGGFEAAPKFPQPSLIEFLLHLYAIDSNKQEGRRSLDMAVKTLRAIIEGGIHDQIGGGFHRYTVDRMWRVPHFEKMLYDQAQLSSLLLTAWQMSGDPALREAACDTLNYVRANLLSPEGGFYSAEDADSDKADSASEGAFYLWTRDEIEKALGTGAPLFCFAYGANSQADAAGTGPRHTVLFRAQSEQTCADQFGLSIEQVRERLAAARTAALCARNLRPHPARDDKVVAAWNGLMISAFARAGQVLADPTFTKTAERAAVFLKGHLFDSARGRLVRSCRADVRDSQGFADDYAFVIQGLLDLYETDFDVQWLSWAASLQGKQDELFLDTMQNGYFANAADDPSVLLRLKEQVDGVEPSANSVSVRNLVRLAEMLHRTEWRDRAERVSRSFNAQLRYGPATMPLMLVAQDWLDNPVKEIVVHGNADSVETTSLIAVIHAQCLPRRVLLRVDAGNRDFFAASLPIVAEMPQAPEHSLVYVCENFVCRLPTGDVDTLSKILGGSQLKALGNP